MINSLSNHRFLRLIFFLVMGFLILAALLLVFQALPGRAQDPQPDSAAPMRGPIPVQSQILLSFQHAFT